MPQVLVQTPLFLGFSPKEGDLGDALYLVEGGLVRLFRRSAL